MIKKVIHTKYVEPLFAGWEETILLSCLQQTMGAVYADDAAIPSSACAILGDFAFYAGAPSKELVCFHPWARPRDLIIMIPQHNGWAELIETCCGDKAKKGERYATKKERDLFDRARLEQLASGLPDGYTMRPLDAALFDLCRVTDWCRDWVSQYRDYAHYREAGLGFVILKDGEPVSGASSYSSYHGGIEIEIDTLEAYRRQGLATVCGARLILTCLDQGLYPSWDAQNKGSLALAEKLGYCYSHAYPVYEITDW